MKRSIIIKILFIAAALLVVGFGVRLVCDYIFLYNFGSAPFYVYVLERTLEFIIPAGICALIGGILKKKTNKNDEH